eukprot:gene4389-4810_t
MSSPFLVVVCFLLIPGISSFGFKRLCGVRGKLLQASSSATESPAKKAFAATLLALTATLGTNFLGSTSSLLDLKPDLFRSMKLDRIYPIGGYLRYMDTSSTYEFTVPKSWSLDGSLLQASRRQQETPEQLRKDLLLLPEVAFYKGQRGSRENVSLVRSPVPASGSLRDTLGDPSQAAEKILRTVMTQRGREAELLSSEEALLNGQQVYKLDYIVRWLDRNGQGWQQHVLAAISLHKSELYTFSVTVPQQQWDAEERTARQIVQSFRLLA